MKQIALFTALLLTSLNGFAQAENSKSLIPSLAFVGSGTWQASDNTQGTWEATRKFTNFSAPGQALRLVVEQDLVLFQDGSQKKSVSSSTIWQFADANGSDFIVLKDGSSIGQGTCSGSQIVNCVTVVTENETTMVERIQFVKNTTFSLSIDGKWMSSKGKGSWTGSMEQVHSDIY